MTATAYAEESRAEYAPSARAGGNGAGYEKAADSILPAPQGNVTTGGSLLEEALQIAGGAAERVLSRYPILYRYGHTIGDLVNDFYLKWMTARNGFDQRVKLTTYVYSIMEHHAIDLLRHGKKREHAYHPDQYDGSRMEWERLAPANGDATDHAELAELVEALSRTLSKKERAVISLLRWGYERGEIAKILKIDPGTVSVRKARALEKMRKAAEKMRLTAPDAF